MQRPGAAMERIVIENWINRWRWPYRLELLGRRADGTWEFAVYWACRTVASAIGTARVEWYTDRGYVRWALLGYEGNDAQTGQALDFRMREALHSSSVETADQEVA